MWRAGKTAPRQAPVSVSPESFKANILQFTPILLLFLYKYTIMELKIFFKKILCRQLTIYQDTESYTINGTLSDTISDITDLILSFSA